MLERELRLGVDLARARGNAAVQVRRADRARDGVQVRHDVPAEDRIFELWEERGGLARLFGEVREEILALVPVLVDGVLERSVVALAVRLGVQVFHGGNDTGETRAGAPGIQVADVWNESNKKCGSERTRAVREILIHKTGLNCMTPVRKLLKNWVFNAK